MTRELRTEAGIEYKVSINFRTHRVSVWKKYHEEWCRHMKSNYLCKYELLSIAYEMSSNTFENFLSNELYWKKWE